MKLLFLKCSVYLVIGSVLFVSACKKDAKVVPGNTAPYYAGIPSVKIENYVNRLFIDLIGREALATELSSETDFLRSNGLSMDAREQLIVKLQTDATYRPGDSSYFYAYNTRLFELTKVRLLEGAADSEFLFYKGLIDFQIIQDSISGDSLSFRINKEKANNCLKALHAKADFMNDSITINQYYFRLLNNAVYDQINMNSFNFIRATFNDLFFRYPSNSEFNASFDMVDKNLPNVVFGKSGQSKSNYLNILVNSGEFHEGVVRWLYRTFLSREASYQEVSEVTQSFYADKDLVKAQRTILKSDEYANF